MSVKNKHTEQYWCLDTSRPWMPGERPPKTTVGPDALPDDADVVIMDMVEDGGMSQDEEEEHWATFFSHIASGKYVKLVKGGKAGIAKAQNRSKGKNASQGGGKRSSGNELKVILAEQSLEEEHWDWSDSEKTALGDAKAMGEVIRRRFEAMGFGLECLYVIVHNKDVRENGQPKLEHVHIVGKLDRAIKGISLALIAEIIGIPEHQVEKPKSGRYAFENACAYLIHMKDPEKAQYEPCEVATACGQDYMELYAEHEKSWERGRATKVKESAKKNEAWLYQQLATGKLTYHSDIAHSDELYTIYYQNPKKFDQARAAYGERKMTQEAEALLNGEFAMTTIFIQGSAGSGKSNLPEMLVPILNRLFSWDMAKCATSHVTELAQGEQVLLLDDVKGNSMDAAELLQFLDPYHANPQGERYKNKPPFKPRLLIITSTKSPIEYFIAARRASEMEDEALDQFLRRIAYVIEVHGSEYAPMTYTLSASQRVESYSASITCGAGSNGWSPTYTECLTYDFVPFEGTGTDRDGMPFYSLHGIIETLVRILDDRNSNIGSKSSAWEEKLAQIPAWIETSPVFRKLGLPYGCTDVPKTAPRYLTHPHIAEFEQEIWREIEEDKEALLQEMEEADYEYALDSPIAGGPFEGLLIRDYIAWAKKDYREGLAFALHALQEQMDYEATAKEYDEVMRREEDAKEREARAEKSREMAEKAEKEALSSFREDCIDLMIKEGIGFVREHIEPFLSSDAAAARIVHVHMGLLTPLNSEGKVSLTDAQMVAALREAYELAFPGSSCETRAA